MPYTASAIQQHIQCNHMTREHTEIHGQAQKQQQQSGFSEIQSFNRQQQQQQSSFAAKAGELL